MKNTKKLKSGNKTFNQQSIAAHAPYTGVRQIYGSLSVIKKEK